MKADEAMIAVILKKEDSPLRGNRSELRRSQWCREVERHISRNCEAWFLRSGLAPEAGESVSRIGLFTDFS